MPNIVKQAVVTSKPTPNQFKTEITTELPDDLVHLRDILYPIAHSIISRDAAIMSSALGGRDTLTSPLGQTQKQAESLPLPDTPSKIGQQGEQKLGSPLLKTDQRAPRSLPDVDLRRNEPKTHGGEEGAEDEDDEEEEPISLSNEDDEGELVPAAGRINEKGEVIDDDGNAIGRVTSGDAQQLVGLIVTQEGDILDGAGGVVGKAEPLEDVASELNYTTRGGKEALGEQAAKGGDAVGEAADDVPEEAKGKSGGGLRGVLGGVGNALGGLTGGVGKTAKGATGAAGGAVKGVTDTAGEATGTEGVTGQVGDTAEGATGAVGDTAKGAVDTAGDATEPVTDTVDGAAGDVTDKVGEGVEGVEGVTGEVGEGVEDVTGKVSRVLTPQIFCLMVLRI